MVDDKKEKIRKREKLLNNSLAFLILSVIFLILGFVFIPLAQVTVRHVTTFMYSSFEAIMLYLFFLVSAIFLVLFIIYFVKYFKLKKVIKNENQN